MMYVRLMQAATCLAAAICVETAQAAALLATNFFPAANATGVCADVPLKITFDGVPAVGTNGTVKIYHASGALVDTVNLALSAADGTQSRTIGGTAYNAYPALVSGNTATVFPHAGVLAYGSTYYVTVDAGVFPGYAGVSGSTAWRFTTRASPSSSATSFIVNAAGGGDFCTVQGVLDFLPAGNLTRRTINIRSGTYQEIVRVSAKHNLAFRGQNRRRTVIAYPNNSTINPNTNTRPLFNVVANDVSFDNLTLSNTTPDGGSQAEALRVNGQRCVAANCDLHSYQDTLLVNSAADSAYFVNSLIEGDADFIWGSGRAVFQSCEIKSLSGGYLCMARNPAGQFGAVFLDCRLTRAAGVTGVYLARIDPSVYTNSSVAFVNCAMDAHIAPAGWLLTAGGPTNDLRFWEHQSTDLAGAPLNVSARAAFSAQVGAAQASALRDLPATFGGWRPIPPLPAFPGAEGAGARALGGRGGDVYTVTTLADSGAGSLRDAIKTAPASGRTVLFRVSGTIALNSTLDVNRPRLTIAGQSAPGGGICLKNYTLRINADDVVVRHIRSRLGTGAMREDDAITVWGGINVLLDHCTASWSVDEVLSSTGETDNLTVQWCMISEALDNSIHSKGPHGFGSIIASYLPARISFHHNLYAHNESRNPRPGNYSAEALSLDFRNNVLYDWGYFIGYNSGEQIDLNYVGNYLVKGPGSSSETAFRSGDAATQIFQSGNKLDLNKNGAFDGADTGWGMFGGTYTAQSSAFATDPSQTTEAAERALQRVVSQVGALPWQRDAKDRAVALDVLNGTGGFVDTTDQAGGYPVLATAPARIDSDGDGMPDYWESAVGLNPSSAGNNLDADGDGYTDLEDYLNWLAAPHAVTEVNAPAELDLNALNGGRTNVTYALGAATNGTALLQPDGVTVRFVPATNFSGRASFAFSFTALGHVVSQTVGICVSAGLPADLTWRGATPAWDLGSTTNFLKAGAPAAFRNGDTVTFDDVGLSATATVAAALQPSLVIVDAARDYTFNGTGVLAGALSLVKSGSGALALVSSNAYSGGTAVSGGALSLGHACAAGTGPVSLENAALAVGALKPANALVASGTNVISGANGGGVGAMTGDGVVKLAVPSGIFDLSGSQSGFSGTLALTSNASVRIVGTTGSTNATFDLGPGSAVLYNRIGAATVWLGALKGGSSTMMKGYSNGTTLTTFVVGGSGEDSSYAGSIRSGDGGSGTAPTALTKVGAGALTLSGSNTYSGATLVSEGTLRVTGSLGASAVTVASNATLCGSGRIAGPVAVQAGGRLGAASGAAGTLSIGAGLSLADAALTLNLGSATAAGSGVNDLLSLSGGALTLSGTVTVSPNLLSGPLTNGTYTLISGGTATVSTATLVWGGSESGGRQRVAFDTGTPGALKLVVTGMPAALRWSGASGATWDSGDPTNEASGAPNWRNGGAADRFVKFDAVTFDDTLTAGVAAVAGAVEPHAVLVSNVTKAVTINAVTGSIVGATSLVKSGAGTLTLEGTNTYAGGTTITAGTLQLASDAANASALGSGPVTLRGGALSMYSNLSTYNHAYWNVVVPSSSSGTLNCDARCYLHGLLSGGGTLNVYVPYVRTEFDGDWSAFAGQLNVTADADGGEFRIGNDSTPFGLPDAAVNLGPRVTLKYVAIVDAGGETQIELGALSGDASSLLSGGPTTGRTFTWQVGKRNADTTFAGTISEQSAGCLTALTKVGAGALRLCGACSNVGPTAVAGGRLLVNGRLSSSPISVGAGAALGGTGTVAAVTLASSAALAPGDGGAGVLTVTGPLTLDADCALNFELGAVDDRVNVASNLVLGGTLNVADLGGLSAGAHLLFTYGGALSGAGLTLGSAPTNYTYAIDTATAGQVKLVVTSPLSPFQEWQMLWFGSTSAPEAAATADPDGDGQTNADEYEAATSPTSAASVARLYWRGDGASNHWNIAASSNFWNGARLSRFANGNPVTFDASGSANPTVNLAAAVSPSAVLVSNATAFIFQGAGALAGTGTLTKAGSGTLTVNTTNSHSGGIGLYGGIVVAPSAGALGTGPVTVGGSAVALQFSNSAAVSNAIIVTGGAGQAGYGLLRVTGGTVSLSGPLTLTGTPSVGGGHLYQNGGTLLVNGVITSSVPVSLRYGSATFSGGGTSYAQLNVNAGTAKLGAHNGLATSATVDLGSVSASALDLAGFNQSLAGVTKGANAATVGSSSTNADSVLTLTGTNTFAGVIKDALGGGTRKVGLVVSTSEAVTLTGTNTYSGGTTVAGGTLIADATGTLGAGRLTVAAGATCVVQNVSGAVANGATVYLSGTLSLAAGVTDTVQRLFLDGVLQRSGVWNASRDAAHFSGAGALNVTDGMPDAPSEAFMASWTNKMAVSFVNYAQSEALTNFPVLVVLGTNVSGFAYNQFASPAGADLRFTDRAQTNELSYEIEQWNTNGLSYVWVRVPVLSRASSLVAHWGNAEMAYFPACATNGSTWSEGFLGVWHVSETAGQHRDSSPNRSASELVQVTAQGSAAGVAGGADRFDGLNDYVDLPNMGTQAQVTVECWANLAAVPLAADIGLVSSDPWSTGVMHFKTSTNLQVKAQINGAGAVTSANNLLSVGSWFYAAYTIAGSGANSLKAYCNAALIGSSSGATNNNLTDVNIAREYNGRYLNARVDEVRVSSVARSPAWLWATYMSLMSNAVFNSYGSAGPLASNRPPALAAVADRDVGAGQWLSVAVSASDPDLPPQALSFSLQSAPSGMAVNALSGLITWRPSVAQAGAAYPMKVVVSDAGWPVACATQAFSVTVSPVAQPAIAQPQFVGGKLYLGVSGDAGPDYSVQASSNLVDWATVFTTNSPAPPFFWTDPGASLYRTRFYRVLIGP